MQYGDGDYRYELDEGWGKLPEGYEFHQVAGVAVDGDDNVYLFNRSAHQMMVFDREGGFIKSWDQRFAGPHGIHIGPDGNIYLADRDAHVIVKYSLDGELLQELGNRDQASDTGYGADRVVHRAAEPFNLPTGIAVTESEDIFVSDGYGKSRVHKFDASGALLLSWGEPGSTEPGQFTLPHGVGLDADGRVLVCDRENHRIQVFDQDGNFLTMWPGFRQPTDVQVGPDGEVYVTELTHRFSIVDGDGNVLARWGGESSHDPGQFVAPHGIAVDSRGDIYIGEVLEGQRIQKFVRVR
ncbi:MAG: peptidyl-alpha-hydroxyglycine alpha-amidating lyase family protein [SAR202 cluster bacterium]|jgi:DNA-binding beta-propeller fold protein YncE|nr:peptidyl-alpha-hydroxyglycine alpha-amidating lyase family protein [SAR202 cluster bacterium]